jgi:DNA-binding NtrC family response regulator
LLLIEDEDSLRSAVAKNLRRRNFLVMEAADGLSAIEILKSDPDRIHVILLDVTLPGISCAELFDELRRIRPEIKIILTTAYSRETAMRGFGERDVGGFIRKPYRTDDLVKTLQETAEESSASGGC